MKKLRRTRKAEEHEDFEGSWAISYGDMITLLLAFFVLFFTVDFDKERSESLFESLKVNLMDMSPENDGRKDQEGTPGNDQTRLDTPLVSLNLQEADMEVVDYSKQLIVDFSGVSFFDSGKVELTTDGQRVLERFAQRFIPYAGNYVLQVQAFTDIKKVRHAPNRRYNDNLELSALRSIQAMRVMQRAGIPLDRMRLAGLGELVLTQKYLERVLADRAPADVTPKERLDLSRKVVLVVIPQGATGGEG